MAGIDWTSRALESEIALSEAYGGTASHQDGFIHISNEVVPWAGDFNRVVDVRVTDVPSLDVIVEQVEGIHRRLGLDAPDRFDLAPPPLLEADWKDELARRGFRLATAVFFRAETAEESLPETYRLRCPDPDEYMDRFRGLAQARGYYDDEWFRRVRTAQERFIRVFRPLWLMERGQLVGWAYCAAIGDYARLFELEVAEEARGRGIGRLLLRAMRSQGAGRGIEHLLLQSGERLRDFYEDSGFVECTRNSILQRS